MSSLPTGSSDLCRRNAELPLSFPRRSLIGPRVRTAVFLAAFAVAFTAPAASPADPAPKRDGLSAAAGLGAFAVSPANARWGAPPLPEREVTEGVIRRGRTLSEMLRTDGVTPQVVGEIARALKGHFDFRRAKPGDRYHLVQNAAGGVLEFTYRASLGDTYRLTRDGAELRVSRETIELTPRSTRIAGIITSTLYQAITNLGEDGSLARDFADIFAWDVDFQRAVRPGDSFQILYERLYRTSGERESYVRPGRILAARFQGKTGDHTAVYFQPGDGRGGYYRPDGSSVEGEFLMTPMRQAKMTSPFSSARRHPILKITRPHRGIDYAAPLGTPIWSVADGVVTHRGWSGGNGNLVKVRHDNGYESSYAHLSRYALGLRVGDRVEQKQVIGYVGQTGLATGPHVCFRIQRYGRYVDPLRLRMPSGAPIPQKLLAVFRATRDSRLAELKGQRRIADGQ